MKLTSRSVVPSESYISLRESREIGLLVIDAAEHQLAILTLIFLVADPAPVSTRWYLCIIQFVLTLVVVALPL